MSINELVSKAGDGIKEVLDELAGADQIRRMLRASREELAKILPDVAPSVFDLVSSSSTEADVLRLLGLSVSHFSEHIEVAKQSTGLGHLVAFAFLIQYARGNPGTVLLIDQPELSLHPQPQRSLTRLLDGLPCQCLIATHSSNLLDRVDPRKIVALRRAGDGVQPAQPSGLSDEAAKRFARYTTAQTAEAFFARSVILVEGLSEVYTLAVLAERMGRHFDAEGVAIVNMEGAGGLKTFIGLLGPDGFGLQLAGICDSDKEKDWLAVLRAAGIVTGNSRSALAAGGFYVSDVDLEDELIRASGVPEVEKLIDEEGEKIAFQKHCNQPDQRPKAAEEQMRTFFARKGRKIRYAPLIMERVDLARVPKSLQGVVDHVD